MRTSITALALCALFAVATPAAEAQEQPLQAANGAAIYLGTFEGIFLVGVPIGLGMALASGAEFDDAMLCMVVFPLCALFASDAADAFALFGVAALGFATLVVVPPIFGGVGGANNWDVDGSLVLTSSVHGLAAGGLFGAGLGMLGDSPEIGALVGGLLGSVLTTSYAAARLDVLARDPRLGVEGNLLMWGPLATMLIGALVAGIGELDPAVAMALVGALGLLAEGAAITLAEVALAQP